MPCRGFHPHLACGHVHGASLGLIYGSILVLSLSKAVDDVRDVAFEAVLFGLLLAVTLAKHRAEVLSHSTATCARGLPPKAVGTRRIKGRRTTGVTAKQVAERGIRITPLQPGTEMRATNAGFEAGARRQNYFATDVVVDGNVVTGRNEGRGRKTAHRILELLAERAGDP